MYRDGIRHSYDHADGLCRQRNTLYIAGARPFGDVFADVNLFAQQTSHTERFEAARQYLDEYPDIDKVIGHNVGEAVALQLQADYNKQERGLHTTTYGAPVCNIPVLSEPQPETHGFRHDAD